MLVPISKMTEEQAQTWAAETLTEKLHEQCELRVAWIGYLGAWVASIWAGDRRIAEGVGLPNDTEDIYAIRKAVAAAASGCGTKVDAVCVPDGEPTAEAMLEEAIVVLIETCLSERDDCEQHCSCGPCRREYLAQRAAETERRRKGGVHRCP